MHADTPPTDLTFDPNDPTLFVEPPLWPKVVGIASICFSAVSLGCMGCGLVGIFVFVPMGEQAMGTPMPDVMRPDAIGWAMMVAGFAGAIFLLVAGIATTTRRPIGRPLHLVWAALSVLLSIGSLYYQFAQQQRIKAWFVDNPDSPWAQQQQQNEMFQYIGLALGLVFGLGWPLFCLIWFGLVKTKPHQMTGTPATDDNPYAPA